MKSRIPKNCMTCGGKKMQDGGSIVNYLAQHNQAFSKGARKELAQKMGIKGYDFSADKNLELLKVLKNQKQEAQSNVSFNTAFGNARSQGLETFNWNGKVYGTKLANQTSSPEEVITPKPEERITETNWAKTNPPYFTASSPQATNRVNPFSIIPSSLIPAQSEVSVRPVSTKASTKTNQINSYSISPASLIPRKEDVSVKPINTNDVLNKIIPLISSATANDSGYKGDFLRIYGEALDKGLTMGPGYQAGKDAANTDLGRRIGTPLVLANNYLNRSKAKVAPEDTNAKGLIPAPIVSMEKKVYTPPVTYGDTVWDNKSKGLFHQALAANLDELTMGSRSRGDRNELKTTGMWFTGQGGLGNNIIDASKVKLNPDRLYMGIDSAGKFQVGKGNDFQGKGFKVLPTGSTTISGFSKDGKNYKMSDNAYNKTHGFALLDTPEGTQRESNLVLTKGRDESGLYGNFVGGKMLITTPDFQHKMFISGSVKALDQQLESFKKKYGVDKVNSILLDNGSAARTYQKANQKLTAEDQYQLDMRDVSGGAGFFPVGKGYKQGGQIMFRPRKLKYGRMQMGGWNGDENSQLSPQAQNWNWYNPNTQAPTNPNPVNPIMQMKVNNQGTPNNMGEIIPVDRDKKIGNSMLGLRAMGVALSQLSGMVDRGRQNQYVRNQLSTLGQLNPMPVEDYQPNPFSLYAKYGGSLKTHMKGGGNWLKGAVNPEHKGWCTPLSNPHCTGHRKAFALMMKKKHGFND